MTARTLIPWADLEAIGGRQEGDPPEEKLCGRGCIGCPSNQPGTPIEADGSGGACVGSPPLVLPESDALALLVLWRHLMPHDAPSVGCIEFPALRKCGDWWLLRHGLCVCVGHGDILDPCAALAAIVHDEAEKARKGGSSV